MCVNMEGGDAHPTRMLEHLLPPPPPPPPLNPCPTYPLAQTNEKANNTEKGVGGGGGGEKKEKKTKLGG